MIRRPPRSTLFPYTRSSDLNTDDKWRMAKLEGKDPRKQPKEAPKKEAPKAEEKPKETKVEKKSEEKEIGRAHV